MSISASELVWRAPASISDLGGNGGRMTATAIPTSVKNNIFPDVPQSERTAGSTKYRKVFIHVANDDDLTLIAPKVFVETRTPGDDAVTFISGTQRDTQSGITGSEQKYGSGVLNSTSNPGATSIAVAVEDANLAIFPIGMKFRISDKASVSGSGNEEYRVVQNVSYVGNVATITFTASGALVYGYAAGSKVSSVYEPGDIACAIANFSVSSAGGTYDNGTYPPLGDNIGTIEQDWTLTFSNATQYTISGDTVGAVAGTYNIGSDAAPNNPAFSKPYFTLRSLGFGGTWQAGNTITFRTSPAAIPIWYRRDVPAGANSLSGNSVIVAVDGESA